MKRFLIALALTRVLTGSALAGEAPSVGFTAPPQMNHQLRPQSATHRLWVLLSKYQRLG
jgi:hypothetical protein